MAEGDSPPSGDDFVRLEDATTPAIGVAISGGGVRAAFYAVGALVYLVHSGLNKQVKLISSVSGGSIPNTEIAMNCDFQDEEPDRFDDLMSMMCNRLARKGVFFLARFALTVMSVVVQTAIWLFLFQIFTPHSQSDTPAGLVIGGIFYALFLTLSIFLLRRSRQIGVYNVFLRSLYRDRNPHRKSSRDYPATLATLPARKAAHVLCATELSSGRPFLMTRQGLFSPTFGRSRHTTLSTAQALYASAAFPGVFPPLRVKSDKVDFSGGPEDEPPRVLYLADGGVFNNLATEGLATLAASAEQKYLVEPVKDMVPMVQRNLVINASAPPTTRRIGLIKLTRAMSVMYESTVMPRIERLMEQERDDTGPIVIDVAESPIELAERIASGRDSSADPVAKRATTSIDDLRQKFTDGQWETLANAAARTKTVLSAVGRRTAIRLVFFGYLDAAIACNAHLDTPGVEAVPVPAWFGSFIDHNVPDAAMTPIRRPAWWRFLAH